MFKYIVLLLHITTVKAYTIDEGIELYNNKKYTECISVFESVIYDHEKRSNFNKDWVESYNYLINSSWNFNRLDLKEAYFKRINEFQSKIKPETLPYFYRLKGNYHYLKNNHQEASIYYLKSIEVNDQTANENLLESFFYLKKYNKVIELYEKLKIVNPFTQIIFAYSLYENNNKDKALKIVNNLKTPFVGKSYFKTLIWLSNFYLHVKYYDKAEYYYKIYLKKTIDFFGAKNRITAMAYSSLAYFYWYAKSDYNKSLDYYNKEIYSLVPESYSDNYYRLPDITQTSNDDVLSKALNNKAEALYEVSKSEINLKSCLSHLELALKIAKRYKETLLNDEQKLSFADYIQHRYPFIINVCYELFKLTNDSSYAFKAFSYSEMSKASMLLSLIKKDDNTKSVNIKDLQKILKDETLLEYSLSEKKLITFIITKKDFIIKSDTISKSFFDNVEKYRSILSDYSYNTYNEKSVLSFAKSALVLYNRLIKPVESYLKGRLIIIPDNILIQIPFETLITNTPTELSYKSFRYLIKKYIISYDYSATLYALNSKTVTCKNTRLLAVAPGYENLNDSIKPLPDSYSEVKKANRFFKGKILLKDKATKHSFNELAGQYDILHLATHGIINNEYPILSKLVFYDSSICSFEIYNMHINAPLVVLSACNTGYGKFHKGEGVMSLSRGFFTAGAKSIVMTLWPVPDRTSSKIMGYFYSNLAAKQNIAESLCNAKLTYLNQCTDIGAHPNLWTGYVVVGNNSTIFEPKKNYSILFISLIALTLLISFKIFFAKG